MIYICQLLYHKRAKQWISGQHTLLRAEIFMLSFLITQRGPSKESSLLGCGLGNTESVNIDHEQWPISPYCRHGKEEAVFNSSSFSCLELAEIVPSYHEQRIKKES